jgi:hypothetical protein
VLTLQSSSSMEASVLPTSSRASSQPSTPALSPARGVTFGETESVTTEEIEGVLVTTEEIEVVLPSGNVYLLSDEGCVMSVVDNDTRSVWPYLLQANLSHIPKLEFGLPDLHQ